MLHPSLVHGHHAGARRRRWRVPPPHLRSVESVESAGILEEFPGSLGLLLWQCTRDVATWGLTPHPERGNLFSADAEHRRLAALILLDVQAREVEQPIRTLARMLSRAQDTDPEVVLIACQAISQWAEAREAQQTALAFAQASALAAPGSARACLRVGQMARRRAEYARAEQWLQRAALLARQNRDRDVHAWAYSALGTLHFLRGGLPRAERHHLRALRIAERFQLHGRRAAALHDLFVVCGETDRPQAALGYARRAFDAYGPGHLQLPALAHDVAHLWLVQGQFQRALRVLRAVWPHFHGHRRALALATAARAAGGMGDRPAFAQLSGQALELLDSGAEPAQRSAGLLALAHGAVGVTAWDFAQHAAERALALAEHAGEAKTQFEAEALLDSIRRERRAGQPSPAPALQDDVLADRLVDDLVECLAAAPA